VGQLQHTQESSPVLNYYEALSYLYIPTIHDSISLHHCRSCNLLALPPAILSTLLPAGLLGHSCSLLDNHVLLLLLLLLLLRLLLFL
jgi:hypothetical protein